jgi:hypothetical protein
VAVRVTVSTPRLEAELRKWLGERIAELSQQILAGVPVDVYKERCAELRSYTRLEAELPEIIKKAKD